MALFDRKIIHSPETASYWAGQSKFTDTTVLEQDANTLGCNTMTCVFSRTSPSGVRDDIVEINFNIAQLVAAGVRTRLVDANMAAAEGLADTLFTGQASVMSAAFTLIEYRWHERGADRPRTGPAVRVTTKSIAGGVATSRLPDQVANTVTFLTSSRRHWGRVYWPGIAFTQYDTTFGRLLNTRCDGLAGAVRTFALGLEALGSSLTLGVWSQQFKAWLDIDEIHVDNVPDVIRSRRAKQPSYIKKHTG